MARYSDEEVDEILRRAIERQKDQGAGLSHDDLVAAAGEIGIAPADVEAAVAEVRQAGSGKAAVAEPVDEDTKLYLLDRQSRRAGFLRHLATYLVVNGALAGMNALTGGTWWVLWVVLGWGIGIALHGLGALLPDDPARRARRTQRLRHRRDKETRRLREQERRQERRRERRSREKAFESAVQEGVGLLLSAAARKIEDAVERSRREREGVRVATDDDRVRVDVGDDARLERDDDAEKKKKNA
jgi:hypothetical protein